MHDENAPSLVIRAAVAAGVLLAVAGVVWWMALLVTDSDVPTSVASTERVTSAEAAVEPSTAQEPTPVPASAQTAPTRREPRLVTLSEPVLFNDDLGTGSTEFSAVTLNEATNRLLIVDDEGQLFEFDLDDQGVPIVPPRRVITIAVGDSDIEGLAWISATTYVIAHEATGELSVIDIDEGQLIVSDSSRSRIIDTQVPEIDGSGIEGVTHVETIDDVEFVVAVERPPSMIFVDDDGARTRTLPLRLGVDDVADVWAAGDGSLWVVSDLGRVIVRMQVGADGSVRQLQQVDLVFGDGQFEQPEGLVVSRDGERLYVVGESPGPGQYSLGVWWLS